MVSCTSSYAAEQKAKAPLKSISDLKAKNDREKKKAAQARAAKANNQAAKKIPPKNNAAKAAPKNAAKVPQKNLPKNAAKVAPKNQPAKPEQESNEVINAKNAKSKKDTSEEVEDGGPKVRTFNQSVLFPQEDVIRLNTVLDAYIESQRAKMARKPNNKNKAINNANKNKTSDVLRDIVRKLKPVKEAAEKVVVPKKVYIKAPAYFYLDSVMYKSAGDSNVWINGNQIDEKEVNDGLSIKSVSLDGVDFIWRVVDAQLPMQDWAKKAAESSKNSESRILVNPSARIIRFSLGVNQTFNVRDMVITEGKNIVQLQGKDNEVFYDPRFPETKFTPEGKRIMQEKKEAAEKKAELEKKRLEAANDPKRKAAAIKRKAEQIKNANNRKAPGKNSNNKNAPNKPVNSKSRPAPKNNNKIVPKAN